MVKLQQKINYQFSDISLLKLALTHRSVSRNNNERLEFLGDSILSAVISGELYSRFGRADEGKLSRFRSHLVRGKTLVELAQDLAFLNLVRVANNELKDHNSGRESILENTIEAIFGAVFLDSDFATVKRIILNIYQHKLANININDSLKDPKTQLQEYLQKHNNTIPKYTLINTSGKDHNAIFTINCALQKPKIQTQQSAKSIKKAEQSCAQILLAKIKNNEL